VIVAVVQARMGSSRLPKKSLADICGRPMLARLLDRVRAVRLLDKIVVATTDQASDDPIAQFCQQEGVSCFRGSEQDVLDRFYCAAKKLGADTVVRITADCPLIDPEVIDKVIVSFKNGDCDYASNALRYT